MVGAHPRTFTHRHSDRLTHSQTHTHAHSHPHSHTDTQTHTHTVTHTSDTHTHTHLRVYTNPLIDFEMKTLMEIRPCDGHTYMW